jgi:nitrate reductase gamma subunit
MSDSSSSPTWTDHDVSDPGITLLQALVYVLGGLTVVAGGTALVWRRLHRTGACEHG